MANFSHLHLFIASIAGLTTASILRLTGRSATTLPGRVTEIIDPQALSKSLAELSSTIVVVGTNGKTTTSAMLSAMLRLQGYEVLSNSSGSNFNRGILSSLLQYNGDRSHTIGVFELDEAHSKHFVAQHHPDHVLVLNLMRDQLDRYGELDYTRQLLANAAAHASKSVIVNGNNADLRMACTNPDQELVAFGASSDLAARMTHHDNRNPSADSLNFTLTGYGSKSISVDIGGNALDLNSSLDGLHNAMNFTAALATALQVDKSGIDKYLALASKPPKVFGRGESIKVGDTQLKIVLVKNPEGFQRALETEEADAYAIAINDNYADGRDPSWLWDVETFDTHLSDKEVLCAGTRANDMALRLAYATDADSDRIKTIDSITALVEKIPNAKHSHITAFCTYTAMLELRSALASKGYIERGGVHA